MRINQCKYYIRYGAKYMTSYKENKSYSRRATAPTFGVCHTNADFLPCFSNDKTSIERLTVCGYLKILLEAIRWGDIEAKKIIIIPVSEIENNDFCTWEKDINKRGRNEKAK